MKLFVLKFVRGDFINKSSGVRMNLEEKSHVGNPFAEDVIAKLLYASLL